MAKVCLLLFLRISHLTASAVAGWGLRLRSQLGNFTFVRWWVGKGRVTLQKVQFSLFQKLTEKPYEDRQDKTNKQKKLQTTSKQAQ